MLTNSQIRAKADYFRAGVPFVPGKGYDTNEIMRRNGIKQVESLEDIGDIQSTGVLDFDTILGAANTAERKIFVRQVLYDKMMHFTAAHEIGHIALHQGKGMKLRQ